MITRSAPAMPDRRHRLKIIALMLLLTGWLAPAAFAQLGGSDWTAFPVKFKVQWPTNAAKDTRYFVTNEPTPTYHCLLYRSDGAFSPGNTTKPRTEQRFTPDYTHGEIQYQSMELAPADENSYCIFQIHTGDAQSPGRGATVCMLFWFTNYNGSICDYSGTRLATNLGNQWFQLNVDHNLVTHTIRVWINQKPVLTKRDNGAGDFYFKDGVYEQSHHPTPRMDTYIRDLRLWTSPGTNQPAAATSRPPI